MVKARSKNSRNSRNKNKAATHVKKTSPVTSHGWVDRVAFLSVDNWPNGAANKQEEDEEEEENVTNIHSPSQQSASSTFSIISWNVLAESYCSPRSHQMLPRSYRDVVFVAPRRRKRILQVLEQFVEMSTDLIALQEVDLDVISTSLKDAGYQGIETPRHANGGSTGGKVDSCALFVRQETFDLLEHQLLRLDDLATHTSKPSTSQHGQEKPMGDALINSNWQGLQHSFLRRNAAMIVRVRHKATGKTLVVVNCHLYWNPGYEYVKLCQMHFILTQARAFLQDPHEHMVLAGDLNSRPCGVTHSYLSRGQINAKRVAPWYAHHINKQKEETIDFKTQFGGSSSTNHNDSEPVNGDVTGEENDDEERKKEENGNETIALANRLSSITLNDEDIQAPLNSVKYLLDFTLNKLCRWFRILGLDTAIEQESEEQLRTKENKFVIFDRCRKEGRTLLTTSTRLMARRECPPGTYCINPAFLKDLEVASVHVLKSHGYELEPHKVLTRCVVCNGNIVGVEDQKEKCRILSSYEAPTEFAHEMDVYECDSCKQGYWWDDRPNSSASRVKSTAKHLFELCLRAGIPVKKGCDLGIFEGQVNVEEERARGWDFTASPSTSQLLLQQLDVVDWLKDENLTCPFQFTSAYATKGGEGELVPFTNVTHYFVSTLDYIFFESAKLKLESRLYVPTSFTQLNEEKIDRGHLLPSNLWPSDHLAIGATFSFQTNDESEEETQEPPIVSSDSEEEGNSEIVADAMTTPLYAMPVGTGMPPPPPVNNRSSHAPRCACGCVPNIPSLLEMAEARKKYKEQQQQKKKNNSNGS